MTRQTHTRPIKRSYSDYIVLLSIFMSTVEMKNLMFSFTLFTIVTATIVVRQHLGSTDVARAVEMLEMDFPQHQVADIVGVSQSVVAQLWS